MFDALSALASISLFPVVLPLCRAHQQHRLLRCWFELCLHEGDYRRGSRKCLVKFVCMPPSTQRWHFGTWSSIHFHGYMFPSGKSCMIVDSVMATQCPSYLDVLGGKSGASHGFVSVACLCRLPLVQAQQSPVLKCRALPHVQAHWKKWQWAHMTRSC